MSHLFPTVTSTTFSTLAAALTPPQTLFTSVNNKTSKLILTPHHLFYLLSKFEDLGIAVGPMYVRLENLHAESSSSNYVSFLNQDRRPKSRRSDNDSVHSVSSVRGIFSGMTSIWANLNLGSTSAMARTEKQKSAIEADLTYLYASFTKIPCLRLAQDRRARLIKGYEEFPFDTAVPLLVFKNLSILEISDIDIRKFFGWDRLAEQLRSLTIKRAGLYDPEVLLINIVLDDMDKRRCRSTRPQSSTTLATCSKRSLQNPDSEMAESDSEPGSPNRQSHIEIHSRPRRRSTARFGSINSTHSVKSWSKKTSPTRSSTSKLLGNYHKNSSQIKRCGSDSSQSSMSDNWCAPFREPTYLPVNTLPQSKWRFLKHLSLADNGISSISAQCLLPLAHTLHSLDLSSNLLTEIPESLASLTALRSLNLSHCNISSLNSLIQNPLPAITALNLRSNQLNSLEGIEYLFPLERLDIRQNKLKDPNELARLTGIPNMREIWVSGNPFTKTHSKSYRVTIFNLFRQVPGHTDDIIIDTFSPGYSEQRYLTERKGEKQTVPIIKNPDCGIKAVKASKSVRECSVITKVVI